LRFVRTRSQDNAHFGGHAAIFERGGGVVRHEHRSLHPTRNASLQIEGADICDDANDGPPTLVVEEPNVFADGVLIRPKKLRGLSSEDGNGLAGHVGIGERPA